MKVILLYLVLEKLVFRAFQNVGSTTVLLLVYKAFSEHFFFSLFFCDYSMMVFKVKFHRAFRIGRKQIVLCLTQRVLREQDLGFVTCSFIRTQQRKRLLGSIWSSGAGWALYLNAGSMYCVRQWRLRKAPPISGQYSFSVNNATVLLADRPQAWHSI